VNESGKYNKCPIHLTGTCRVNMYVVQSSLCRKTRSIDRRSAEPFTGPHNGCIIRMGTSTGCALPRSSQFPCPLELNSLTRRNPSYSVCQCPQLLRVWFIHYYPLGKPTSFQWKYSPKYFCSYYWIACQSRINGSWNSCASAGMLL